MFSATPEHWKMIQSKRDFFRFCNFCEAGQLSKLLQLPEFRAKSRQYARTSASEKEIGIEPDLGPVPFSQSKMLYHSGYLSPLYLVTQRGLTDVIRVLLADGADVNDRSSGATPLTLAAQENSVEVMRTLLSYPDVDPNLPTKIGDSTPLLIAIQSGSTAAVRELLAFPRVDIRKARAGDHATPLSVAAFNGRVDIVEMLLKKDCSPAYLNSKSGRDKSTPLSQAATQKHVPVVKMLLDTGKADVNATNMLGYTPLMMAGYIGANEVVKLLLGVKGIDINKPGDDGATPLLIAAEVGRTSVVRMMLSAGADPTLKGKGGYFPLLAACQYGHTDIARLLLEASPQSRSMINEQMSSPEDDSGPLHYAVQNNHLECAKILLKYCANVDQFDKVRNSTPLMMAAFRGPRYLPMLKLLMESGADPDLQTKGGQTVYDFINSSVVFDALERFKAAREPVRMSLDELKDLPVQKLKSVLKDRNIAVPSGAVEKGELAAYILEHCGEKSGHKNGTTVTGPALDAHAHPSSDAAPDAQPSSSAASDAQPSSTRACLWCGSQPPKLKMCGGCKSVYICSTECQKASWGQHRAQCRTLAEEKRIKKSKS